MAFLTNCLSSSIYSAIPGTLIVSQFFDEATITQEFSTTFTPEKTSQLLDKSKMYTHVFILLEETPGWPCRTSIIFCVCFAGKRKTRGERALRVTRVRSGEKKGYTPIHNSGLFHRINDATANSIRKRQPSVSWKKFISCCFRACM